MKRFFTLAIALLNCLVLSAQDHLEFKAIPIDGTTSSFVESLTKAGFKKIQQTPEGVVLSGTFTGKECNVIVESSIITKTPHSVYVLLSEESDWATIKNDYNTIKKGLTLKYGEPAKMKEEIRSPYKEGDGSAYMAFKGGYADWYSVYTTPLGEIDLYIREQGYSNLSVIIKYVDKANEQKSIEELTNDL
ncbi:MAG: hypothetical protein IKX53_01190 [Bacteroidales bacterium]|nr:hypothetical protein [Bacteroidales bacterium]